MDINYQVQSNKSFDQAVADLKQSLMKHQFGVLWELNFKDKLKEKGLDFNRNFKIFEVCNPKQAKEVLEQNIEVGYFLPCKMVIYEKDDHVMIGMIKPSMLIDLVDKALAEVANEVEQELVSAINEAK